MDEYIGNIEAEDVEDHPHEQISEDVIQRDEEKRGDGVYGEII